MNRLFAYGLMAMCLLASGTASAVLMNFNYNNLGVTGGSILPSVNMEVDGIDVNVTAYIVTNDGAGNISNLTQLTDTGTGVYTSSTLSGSLGVRSNNGGTMLDGGDSATDPDEGLLFSFSETVSLDYIDFDYFTSNGGDDFNLTVDGVTVLWNVNAGNSGSLLVNNVATTFDEYSFEGVTGQSFLFWADENSDSFRIDKMRVSSVPEPGSLALFAAGLLGFRFIGKKSS